jgi:hypothetical protein
MIAGMVAQMGILVISLLALLYSFSLTLVSSLMAKLAQ